MLPCLSDRYIATGIDRDRPSECGGGQTSMAKRREDVVNAAAGRFAGLIPQAVGRAPVSRKKAATPVPEPSTSRRTNPGCTLSYIPGLRPVRQVILLAGMPALPLGLHMVLLRRFTGERASLRPQPFCQAASFSASASLAKSPGRRSPGGRRWRWWRSEEPGFLPPWAPLSMLPQGGAGGRPPLLHSCACHRNPATARLRGE